MRQEGAREVSRDIEGVSRSQQTLSKYVVEQRKEQRLQSFLFREAAGSALVLNNALGATSVGAKNLTNSLNAGFATFQGINFLLSGMKGPLGIVISLVGGLGAAMASFTTDEEGGGKKFEGWLDRVIDKLDNLNPAGQKLTQMQVGMLQEERSRLEERIAGPGNMTPGGRLVTRMTFEESLGLINAQTGKPYTISEASTRIEEITQRIKEYNAALSGIVVERGKKLEFSGYGSDFIGPVLGEDDGRYVYAGGMQAQSSRRKQLLPDRLEGVGNYNAPRIDMDEMRRLDEGQQMLLEGALALGDTLRDSLGGAFEDIFGEANSLLEQFAQKIFMTLGSRGIGSLLQYIPGVGPILADAFGTFGGGGEDSISGGGTIAIQRRLSAPSYQMATARIATQRRKYGRP